MQQDAVIQYSGCRRLNKDKQIKTRVNRKVTSCEMLTKQAVKKIYTKNTYCHVLGVHVTK
jgi:hypothetical protein